MCLSERDADRETQIASCFVDGLEDRPENTTTTCFHFGPKYEYSFSSAAMPCSLFTWLLTASFEALSPIIVNITDATRMYPRKIENRDSLSFFNCASCLFMIFSFCFNSSFCRRGKKKGRGRWGHADRVDNIIVRICIERSYSKIFLFKSAWFTFTLLSRSLSARWFRSLASSLPCYETLGKRRKAF